MVLSVNRLSVRIQRHRRIAHRSPILIGAVVDPDLKDGGEQPAHHDEAVFQSGAVQAAATSGGTVSELTAEQINSRDKLL